MGDVVGLNTIDAERALAGAGNVNAACEALADLLVAHGYELPSIYLLRGGRLRCHASRGYWQVIDGFAPGVGVIGKVLVSGRSVVIPDATVRDDFIAAIPGLRGEASVPIDLGGSTIGVLTVETLDVLPDDAVEVLAVCADVLSRRIGDLGGLPPRSPTEVLADHVVALPGLTDVDSVQDHMVTTARELSEMGTVLIARRDTHDRLHITTASGPLAGPLSALTPDALELVAGWVAHGTSCYFAGGTASTAHEFFVRGGAGSVLVLPLTAQGARGGVLVIADEQVVQCSPERVKLLEQLAVHGAATLRSFETAEHLRQLAFTDALTGVGSVTAFAAHRDEHADVGAPMVLSMVDVDHFKAVNDSYGHVVGDELLRELADLLVEAVGPEGSVFRRGGDEFIALRPADGEVAEAIGARLCAVARNTGRFTVSVGVTVATTLDEATLAAADAALYEVKRRGRDGFQVLLPDPVVGDTVVASRRGAGWTVPTHLVDEIHEVVFTADLEGRWTFLNRAWHDLVGVSAHDSLGRPLEEWVHADDVAACRGTMSALLADGGSEARAQWRWVTSAGAVRWCELWTRPLRTPTGAVIGAAGTLTDVTARRAAEQALRTQLGLSTVISGVLERFASVEADDIDAAIDDALARLGRFAGVDRSYLFRVSADATSVRNTHEWCAPGIEPQIGTLQDRPISMVEDWLPQFRAGRAVHVPRVADLPAHMADLRASLEVQHVRSLVVVPLGTASRLIGFLGFDAVTSERTWSDQQLDLLHLVANALVSVVTRHEATEKLARQALLDPLTGLPNRAALLALLQKALDGVSGPLTTGVILVDLDAFKVINDSLGHTAGDDALRGVVARLSAVLRDADVLARLGGDQFAIVCSQLDHPDLVLQIARRVRDAVGTPTVTNDIELYVTASIGVAVHDGHRDAVVLLRDAEAAMRRARLLGRDRIEVFQESLRSNAAQRLELAGDLRRAIDDDQLHLEYQPIVDLRRGVTVGAEALLRWRHPRRGTLDPSEFIGIAENTGQIVSLGRWVLSRASHQLAEWRAQGAADLTMSINVSALQFADVGLLDTLTEATARAGIPAGALELELTESTLMADSAHALSALHRLKGLGVRLTIDDFGTGFSSLSSLRLFPVDRLKIDRAFVGRLGDDPADPADAAVITAICDLGRALGLEVLAEGVDRARQRSTLLDLGCMLAQGCWISRPVAADAFPSAVRLLEGRLA